MSFPRIIRKLSATVFMAAALLCRAGATDFKSIVIFAQMPSAEFSTSAEHWGDILSNASSYFQDQYNDGSTFTFVAGPTVTLTKDYSDANVLPAVLEAVKLANSSVDFSQFDLNQDRIIDNVTIIFSGSAIWPQNNICTQATTLDGKQLGNYSALCELFEEQPTRLGIFCHEFGHSLGLTDLYDVDGEGSTGSADALWGSIALMDRGDRNNGSLTPSGLSAVEHDMLNIGTRDTLRTGNWTLSPIGRDHRYIVIPTQTSGEYFLLECRQRSGWDEFIGGEGLLLYHMDKSGNSAGFSTRFGRELSALERWTLSPTQVNCNPLHQCADLLEADPDASSVEQVFIRSGSISSDSHTPLRSWSGSQCELAITDIQIQADGSASFKAIKPIDILRKDAFQTAIVLDWQIDPSLNEGLSACSVSWSKDGELLGREDCIPNEDGSFSILIDGLFPTLNYQTPSVYKVEIKVEAAGTAFSLGCSLATEIFDQRNSRPYIALRSVKRNADGSFTAGTRIPLVLNNVPASAPVKWFFDDEEITPAQDGSFIARQSGKLRACIEMEDGSTTVITKVINISDGEDAEQ